MLEKIIGEDEKKKESLNKLVGETSHLKLQLLRKQELEQESRRASR